MILFVKPRMALASVAQLVEHYHVHQKVASLVPGQGMYGGHLIYVSFSLSSSSSLSRIYIYILKKS